MKSDLNIIIQFFLSFFFFNCDQSTFRIYVIVFFRLYQRAFTRSCSIESIPSINMEYEIIFFQRYTTRISKKNSIKLFFLWFSTRWSYTHVIFFEIYYINKTRIFHFRNLKIQRIRENGSYLTIVKINFSFKIKSISKRLAKFFKVNPKNLVFFDGQEVGNNFQGVLN